MVKKKVKKRAALFLSVFIIIMSALCIIFLKSDYFLIKNIKVSGNVIVSKDDILNSIKLKEVNIFFINTKTVKKDIMNNPYIEKVKIVRSFPSTIIINVTEKETNGYVKINNSYITIDKNCRMIQTSNNISGNKPLIEGIDLTTFIPGKCIFEKNDKRLNSLMEVLKISKYKEFKNNIASINIKNQYDIVVSTKDGYDIKIGNCDDLEYKFACAYSIMNNSNVKGTKGTIEVDSDGIAVFKKK